MTTTITALPTAPSTSDPSTFASRADALIAALPTMISQMNAAGVEVNTDTVTTNTNNSATTASAAAAAASAAAAAVSAASAVAASTTNGTSASAITIGTGSKTFTTQSSKNWVVGMWMMIAYTTDPTNYMYGYVTSYSGTTLIVTVTQTGGSGNLGAWTIALSAPQATILTPLTLTSIGASIRPSLLLDFGNNKNIDPRITVVRSTSAGRYNAQGLYEQVAAGQSRIDHNPATGECLGLLIEETRSNLIIRSEAMDNVVWTKDSVSITANSLACPDGNTNADTITATAGTGTHDLNQAFTATAVPWTMSIYAKAGTTNWLALSIDTAATAAGAFFNLTTGVVGTVAASGTATIQDCGNGWYRCSLTRTLTAASRALIIEIHTSDNQAINFNAAGTETLYVWGAMAEAGGFVTSYIPTASVTAARQIDVHSISVLTPWHNALEGTIQIHCDNMSPAQAATRTLFQFDNAGTSDYIGYLASTTGIVNYLVEDAGVTQAATTAGTIVGTNTLFKASFSYKANSFNVCKDASAVTTDSAGTVPTITTVRLGTGASSNIPLNGHIRKFAYYPKQLSSAELVAITTA